MHANNIQMQMVEHKDIARLLENVTGNVRLADELTSESRLLGVIPELDSVSVVHLIVALEKRYSFQWHDDEVDESIFHSLGSLAEFVQLKVDALQSVKVAHNNSKT